MSPGKGGLQGWDALHSGHDWLLSLIKEWNPISRDEHTVGKK